MLAISVSIQLQMVMQYMETRVDSLVPSAIYTPHWRGKLKAVFIHTRLHALSRLDHTCI